MWFQVRVAPFNPLYNNSSLPDPVHNRVLSHAASAVPANLRLPKTDCGPPNAECRSIHLHVQHILRAKLPAEVFGRWSADRRGQQQPSGLQTKGSDVTGAGIGQPDTARRPAIEEGSVTGTSRERNRSSTKRIVVTPKQETGVLVGQRCDASVLVIGVTFLSCVRSRGAFLSFHRLCFLICTFFSIRKSRI